MTSVCVTGGASGIGRAIAEHFARAGAAVAVGDVDSAGAEAVAASLGRTAIGVGLDVRDRAAFAAFLDAAEEAHGPLDVLVNNAGVVWTGLLHEQPEAALRREIDINLVGTALGSQLALERMVPRGRGHVVNVSSGAGRMPLPEAAVYAATKHGIVGLTNSLRLAYGDSGVRFSVVFPGQIATPMLDALTPSPRIPVITPDEVATAVVRAVKDGRYEVNVPRAGGPSTRVLAALPTRVSDAILRRSGMFELTAGGDPSARQSYRDRAFGE